MDKTCAGCGQIKNISLFHFSNGKPKSRCKECRNQENAEWRQGNNYKAYKQEWDQKNKSAEKLRWRGDEYKQTRKLRYQENKGAIISRSLKWAKENKGGFQVEEGWRA